ncbi:hypothetical protein H310_00504 [Aphanomyces invadans]|uniref:Uncharacterized protein n=1 Tax=Aphanomyces invadans TaxID=157072 RepID=A0A024UW21_9STRA|nr:hypothetical protein H310_00504 [Aphanomyces invadans]ETW10132.1 hypothetical protein H310_00504 [Aphanomyces invadans]|eukprot:XP_008861543.1 hypothetical protein H310_00504 [Aphanomyces invadans]
MDNAKYHKCLPHDTPRYGWSKARLQNACRTYGISFNSNDPKCTLWTYPSKHIDDNVVPVVVAMQVLEDTPLLWAITKGDVGRQYCEATSFRDVLDRLNKAFLDVAPSTIHGCVTTFNRRLAVFHTYLGLKEVAAASAESLETANEQGDRERGENGSTMDEDSASDGSDDQHGGDSTDSGDGVWHL